MDVAPDPVDPEVIVITGAMAAGKSTVAAALARRFTRSVHVRGDLFRRMVVGGREDATPGAGPESERQLDLRYQLGTACTDAYAAAGFTVVYQDIILGEHLLRVIQSIVHRPLSVVVLCPSSSVLARREEGRSKVGYGEWTPHDLDRVMRAETPPIGLWLDSGPLTITETVDAILGDETRLITP